MDPETALIRKRALAFLTGHKTGVLSTVSEEGNPQSRMVYYTADSDFNIYFLTLADTRKFGSLTSHPPVAFTVSNEGIPQTIQIEGVAMDITLDEAVSKKRDELFKILNSNPWFPAPTEKLGPGAQVVVWIKPTWIRWADYAYAPEGPDRVYKIIPVQE